MKQPLMLRLALLQIEPGDSLQENLQRGEEACRAAKRQGADLALFPEMWSNGYRLMNRPVEDWQREAIPADGPFVTAFAELAAELQMAIGITLLEESPQGPRNTLVLIDRFGRPKLRYAKVHTCDFDVERFLVPGYSFFVSDLDIAYGTVRVGAMICYDREFPESARILMLQGAELILVPNACPMEINRLAQLRARAYENMLAIATCNYPDTVPDCNGGSTVFDGVAYLPEEEGSRDTCLLQAGPDAGIYLTDLNLTQLRQYRAAEMQGDTYRRPHKYALLVEDRLQPPFVRPYPRR